MEFPALTHDEYARTFKTFLDSSTETKMMSTWFKQVAESLEGKAVKFLSIGAGFGRIETEMVKTHGLKMSFYYAIEPGQKHRATLEENIKSWGFDIPYEIDPSYFTPEFKTEHRFDVVLMSHALYGIPKWREVLEHIHSLLAPGGKFVLFHHAETFPQVELCKHGKLVPPPIGDHTILPSHIADFLNEKNIQNSVDYITVKVLINEFVKGNEDEPATHVVDFLMQTWYKNLAKKVKEAIRKYVVDKTIKDAAGTSYMKMGNAMFVIKA